MKSLGKFLNKFSLTIYLFSLILIELPPFYFIFSFLNTHSIAKVIWLFLLSSGLLRILQIKKAKYTPLFILFGVFFVAQTISGLFAFNSLAFLAKYEDVFFSGAFFVVSFWLIREKKQIMGVLRIFLALAAVNTIFQFLIFLNADLFTKLASSFVHQGYLEIISVNAQRKRIFLEIYDEALIPIIFYFVVQGRNKLKFSLLGLLILSTSFISNFRTRFLMLIFSLFSSIIVFLREAKKYIPIVFLLPFVFYLIYSSLYRGVGFTVIERVLLEDKREDVQTILGRFGKWGESLEMGLSSPLFGVGLGNYYEYLSFNMKQPFYIFQSSKSEFELAAYDPHGIFFSVFAETGFFGLLSLGFLLVYFGFKDMKVLLSGDLLAKSLVISFWTIFIHALFNPSFTVKYQTTFWLLRILIERIAIRPLRQRSF